MNYFFTLLVILLFCSNSTAQNEDSSRLKGVNHHLLIPYNLNGVWGWSDTLGNIIIEPRYKKTYFFRNVNISEPPIKEYQAKVETEAGINYVDSTGHLLVPEKYHVLTQKHDFNPYRSTSFPNFFVVQDSIGKIGIFNSKNGKDKSKLVYDSISTKALKSYSLFLKKNDKNTWDRFSYKEKKFKHTDATYFTEYDYSSNYKNTGGDIVIATSETGKHYSLFMGGYQSFGFGDENTYYKKRPEKQHPLYRYYRTESWNPSHPDSLLRSVNLGNDVIEVMGCSQLFLWIKDQKMGVLNERNELVLPFIYDEIKFTHFGYSTQVILFKDGKQGMRLLDRAAPLIEPKYDSIRHWSERIKKERTDYSPRETFLIFRVELGDQIGYVGENGVEYFHFDN